MQCIEIKCSLLIEKIIYMIHWCLFMYAYELALSVQDFLSDLSVTTGDDPTTCWAHKNGDIALSASPKGQTSELAGFFSALFISCWASSREVVNTFLKPLVWLVYKIQPMFTDCKVEALSSRLPRSTKQPVLSFYRRNAFLFYVCINGLTRANLFSLALVSSSFLHQ